MRVYRLFEKSADPTGSTSPVCTILAIESRAARQYAADVLANPDWLDPDLVLCSDVTDTLYNPCLIEILDEPE